MGWSEEQTNRASMQYIETAYRGRIKMLEAIFGKSDDAPKNADKKSSRQMTPKLFDALFGG